MTFFAEIFERNLAVNIKSEMKKLARVVGTQGRDEMYLYRKNITKPLSNASVAVDDDPEEAAGGETVGRTRRGLEQDLEQAGQALEQAEQDLEQAGQDLEQAGQVLEQAGQVLEHVEQVLEQAEQALEQAPGRVSEEFATVLEEFESAVSVPAEETSIYLESADKSADGLGPFFSGMLTDVVEIFETSPHSAAGGGLAR